jgi:hypothetical protein
LKVAVHVLPVSTRGFVAERTRFQPTASLPAVLKPLNESYHPFGPSKYARHRVTETTLLTDDITELKIWRYGEARRLVNREYAKRLCQGPSNCALARVSHYMHCKYDFPWHDGILKASQNLFPGSDMRAESAWQLRSF